MSRKHFKGGTLTAPLPPVLVTVGEGDRANVLTVAWTGILASDPPKTYVSIRPSRHSYEILKEGGEFVVNLPSDNLAKAVDCAGIFTGAKVDKFQKCGFTKTESRTVAPPTIAECPVALECRVTEVIPMGTHDVFVADILDVSCDERLLDEKGKIHAKVWGFLHADNVEIKSAKENVNYKAHIAAGECFPCGGEVIDYGFVERFILDLPEKYGVNIVQLGYDRWNALSTVQKLEADAENPVECVEIKQHSSVLHAPTKLLKEYVLGKQFEYDENKLLEINFANARCTEDTNLNKYVNKKRSAGKVDMVVSLINAVFLLQLEMLSGECDFSVQY